MAVRAATDVKNAMIAGLWANSNLDDGNSTRVNALREIDQQYQQMLDIVYNGPQDEIDLKSDPFFAAMKVPDDPGLSIDRTTTTEEIQVDQAE